MLPAHLKRYIVDQDYSRYTPVDQAVWRFIMRQLTSFLSTHAHPCYLEGLAKTGISVDRIPRIEEMSEKLSKFGWRAVPVSGFIPPAAFMELQAYGYLPIASDLRTVDHIGYTPAPDIVHEAAGHAPILIEPEYANYLRAYAQVASKAILSRQDMDQYEAIRVLSDMKENPDSTPEEIKAAEKRLAEVSAAIIEVSEAAYLGRMNWWTAEYGLIGPLDAPKIFGAGLLSSVGEAKNCLAAKVKKIPLTVDCIGYAYDITEQQPQLFVTPDFHHLYVVLEQLANRMAFRRGGVEGLEKAVKAETVNTVELESGLQISGVLKAFDREETIPVYLRFNGPSQLCVEGRELQGHGRQYHKDGFGSPVGGLVGVDAALSDLDDGALARAGIKKGAISELRFHSGVVVRGKVRQFTRHPKTNRLIVIAFDDCTVTRGTEVLFQPAWGVYDMAVGSRVISVFGGPADREHYGSTEDFVAKLIPRKPITPIESYKHELYKEVGHIRDELSGGIMKADDAASDRLERVYSKIEADFPHDWLIRLEIFELGRKLPSKSWLARVEMELGNLSEKDANVRARVDEGLSVLK
ncbi:MAG: aromatic amino acid hydroxylase [Bdellovibrionota bacterium]